MTRFQFEARTRIVRGPGRINELAALARTIEAGSALLVADPALPNLAALAARQLESAGLRCAVYAQGRENPDSAQAEEVRRFAQPLRPELIVALGGGSTMDLAKAAAFLLVNGGAMRDYQGYGLAKNPLPPLIAIPTTTGTGSEAQSYCVIADAETKRKMACGAPSAASLVALLDPELALSQPRAVRAASGFDALSHAVETWVCTKRNEMSDLCAREAWRLLSANFPIVLEHREDVLAIAAMQWGAYLAGWAIEHSMLGAAHACANPLTRRYGATHAHALSVVLPHVVRFNRDACGARYDELAPELDRRLEDFAAQAGLPGRLRQLGAAGHHLEELAEDAASQWTGRHNPRPFDAASALEIYRCAF